MSEPPVTQRATLDAALAMLEPLAGLLLTRELRYADAEELMKTAYVHASARAFAAQGKLPTVSNLSVATGIRRPEVKRLLATPIGSAARKPSVAAQVRLRWATDSAYLDEAGQPRRLPRTAPAGQPSFASLAVAISTDMHARALLDELLRIGAVEEDGDFVTLRQREYQPPRSEDEMVRIAGANVGDHLSAVLMNVLSNPPPLLERAIFVDGLTQASARHGTDLARDVWRELLPGLREKLQAISDLESEGEGGGWRMRIGMYSYFAPEDRVAAPVAETSRKRGRPRSSGVVPVAEPEAGAVVSKKKSRRQG